jgi:hypothetical protein
MLKYMFMSFAIVGVALAQKPVDQMSFGELLTAAKEDLNNITVVPMMRGNPYVTHLQEVIKSVCYLLTCIIHSV